MAGSPAGRLAVRRNTGNFLKFSTDPIISIFMAFTKVQCYYSVTNAFQSFFGIVYCEACYGGT